MFIQWTAGDSNPDYLGANQVSSPWTSGPCFERSIRESNPVFLPTEEVCCRNTYRPSSDPGWSRTTAFLVVTQASSPLDHGIISVTGTGVEPAKSRGSRPRRFSSLRTRSWRVRGSHPAVPAYEAGLSTGPPAASFQVAGPGIEPGDRPYESQLGTCRACKVSVTKGRVELPCLAARRSGRRASSSCATWSCSAARAGVEPAFPA